MAGKRYRVQWVSYARVALANLTQFKVDSNSVFKRSKYVLSVEPENKSFGVIYHPGFEFNGYHWILMGNVIILYQILEDELEVNVDACFFANTAFSHEIFWGIDPEDD